MTEPNVDEILADYVHVDSEEVKAMNEMQQQLEEVLKEYNTLKEENTVKDNDLRKMINEKN